MFKVGDRVRIKSNLAEIIEQKKEETESGMLKHLQ